MDAQDKECRRRKIAARVAAALLAVIISIGLWQMYGEWLFPAGHVS